MNNIHIDTIFMAERKLLCARHIGPYQGIGAAFEKLERELSRLGLRADAILDRLVHNAHRIALAGESMRKKKSATAAAHPTGSTQAADRQR